MLRPAHCSFHLLCPWESESHSVTSDSVIPWTKKKTHFSFLLLHCNKLKKKKKTPSSCLPFLATSPCGASVFPLQRKSFPACLFTSLSLTCPLNCCLYRTPSLTRVQKRPLVLPPGCVSAAEATWPRVDPECLKGSRPCLTPQWL